MTQTLSITNRILFLLESECLYGQPFYSFSYRKILKKYLNDVLKFNKQAPRFLLSDIIRYYRTICVDYEFKITEENKDWALRNIKLRFSRKGLYFGGIAILLNSMNKRDTDKYDYIHKNLRLPFADKIAHILLEQQKPVNMRIFSRYMLPSWQRFPRNEPETISRNYASQIEIKMKNFSVWKKWQIILIKVSENC